MGFLPFLMRVGKLIQPVYHLRKMLAKRPNLGIQTVHCSHNKGQSGLLPDRIYEVLADRLYVFHASADNGMACAS
jgi:hypothetical protein